MAGPARQLVTVLAGWLPKFKIGWTHVSSVSAILKPCVCTRGSWDPHTIPSKTRRCLEIWKYILLQWTIIINMFWINHNNIHLLFSAFVLVQLFLLIFHQTHQPKGHKTNRRQRYLQSRGLSIFSLSGTDRLTNRIYQRIEAPFQSLKMLIQDFL